MKMGTIKLDIDGREIEAEAGKSILETSLAAVLPDHRRQHMFRQLLNPVHQSLLERHFD